MDYIEQIQFRLEQFPQYPGTAIIPAARAYCWIKIAKVMIAQQQYDVVMFLLECDDVQQLFIRIAGRDSLPSIRIHVVSKEDNLISLSPTNGIPPKPSSVHVRHYNQI